MTGNNAAVLADQNRIGEAERRMLPAISATCASLCVRALRGDGTSRSIGQCSNCQRSD
jgi:hypothetical protein